MIQTQLLKCDKPYQIISAAGMVGIQVATLIVTEDKVDEDGKYLIDTHSHPVVNYAIKDGLAEELKYRDGNPENEYKYTRRMQPEGAVWNRVEVRDVRVLGLAGAENIPVDLEKFIDLVPTTGCDPTERLWDRQTINKIYSLHYDLESIGFTFSKSNIGIWSDEYFDKEIHLKPKLGEVVDGDKPMVRMLFRSGATYDDNYEYNPTNPIYFDYILSDNANEDVREIWQILNTLIHIFKLNKAINFLYDDPVPTDEIDLEWIKRVEFLTEKLNKLRDNRLKVFF